MGHERRWDPCVAHRGDDVRKFFGEYFSRPARKVLVVAGAGFDPRSRTAATQLSKAATSMRALLIRENRPNPPQDELDRAEENTNALLATLTERQVEHRVKHVEIFGTDGAVVGGRNIINVLGRQNLEGVTDVVVDISGLSAGTTFPIMRYFVEYTCRCQATMNLHVVVVHNPRLDAAIRSIASDAPSYVHGFKGRSTLIDTVDAARLWLPQLALRRRATLERLYDFIGPHDTCPILPFPANEPRLGDTLVEEYLTELQDTWSVDARNIVYADEGDPLDLYRTILNLDDVRKRVFAETGGSILILSPLGSKVMALGALMAALERDLPVAYLESIGYEFQVTGEEEVDQADLVHLWLEGDVYPHPRPALPADRSAAP